MTRLCFGTFARVLSLCKLPGISDPQLVGTMTRTVDPNCEYINNPPRVSRLLSCYGNLSDGAKRRVGQIAAKNTNDSVSEFESGVETNRLSGVVELARTARRSYVVAAFEADVISMIDPDKCEQAVLALRYLIDNDKAIEDVKSESFEKYMGTTKNALLSQGECVFTDFLAGIFLYTVVCVVNTVGKNFVSDIFVKNAEENKDGSKFRFSDFYLGLFRDNKGSINFVDSYSEESSRSFKKEITDEAIITFDEYRTKVLAELPIWNLLKERMYGDSEFDRQRIALEEQMKYFYHCLSSNHEEVLTSEMLTSFFETSLKHLKSALYLPPSECSFTSYCIYFNSFMDIGIESGLFPEKEDREQFDNELLEIIGDYVSGGSYYESKQAEFERKLRFVIEWAAWRPKFLVNYQMGVSPHEYCIPYNLFYSNKNGFAHLRDTDYQRLLQFANYVYWLLENVKTCKNIGGSPLNYDRERQLALDVWRMLLASCRQNAMDEHEERIKEILTEIKGTKKSATTNITMIQGDNGIQIKEISGGNVTFNLGGNRGGDERG